MADYPTLDPDPDPVDVLLSDLAELLPRARTHIAPLGPKLDLQDMERRIAELMAEKVRT